MLNIPFCSFGLLFGTLLLISGLSSLLLISTHRNIMDYG